MRDAIRDNIIDMSIIDMSINMSMDVWTCPISIA